MRELRIPVSDDEFRQLPLISKGFTLPTGLVNLRWKKDATPARLFFASKTGRLTPDSGQVPCLYLASDKETSFEELYGDRFDLAEKNHKHLRLPHDELVNRVYLATTRSFACNLYDLGAPGAARDIGLDLGTLYDAEVKYARSFAQRLHDHPARFDGIRYLSRQMTTEVFVLWNTRLKEVITCQQTDRLGDHQKISHEIAPLSWLFSRKVQVTHTTALP